MSAKRKFGFAGLVAAIVILVAVGAMASRQIKPPERVIPTIKVQRGDVQIDVVTDGEFRAPKSASLVAPTVNGTLQIVYMVPTGTKVKTGDLIIEFDPSEQQYNFEQAESQFKQAEQEIIKAKADSDVLAAQDQTALLKAKFDVRRAELEVQRNELLSEIDARKNNLNLEEAKRKLAQLESDIKARSASGKAGIRVLEARRDAARLQMQVADQNIQNMQIKASMEGIVSAKENRDSTGGFFTTGMVLPEYRAGDLTFPGRILAEVMDVTTMDVQAKINESDRANVSPNLPVDVIVDAQPGKVFPAKVKTVAGLASRNMWSASSLKKFEASFQLEKVSDELRPGVSAQVMIHGVKLEKVLYLPVQCLFEKDGKPLLYAKKGSQFEPVEPKVKYRTEGRIVVEGVPEGAEIAMIDPTAQDAKGSKTSGSALR